MEINLAQDVFQEGEILSPYQICICILFREASTRSATWSPQPTLASKITQFLVSKITVTTEMHEPTLYMFICDILDALPSAGKRLQRLLLAQLQAIETLEDLMACCSACWAPPLLRDGRVGDGAQGIFAESPAGRFLRTCRITFEAAPFETTVHMLTSLRGYVEVYHRELSAQLSATTSAGAAAATALYASTRNPRPLGHLADYLAQHAAAVRALQGAVPGPALEAELQALGEAAPDLPGVHAARAQVAALSKTLNVELESRLHFHDFAIPASSREAGAAAAAAVPDDGDGRARPLQQALLSLSALHARHGHVARALATLLEAVDVDQGSGDGESLLTCLLQLCAIMRAAAPAASLQATAAAAVTKGVAPAHFHLLEQLLQHCVAQAAQHRLPVYFANALLATSELSVLHQPQPGGAAVSGATSQLCASDGAPLTYLEDERGARREASGGAHRVARVARPGVSPSAVVWQYSLCLAEMEHACEVASFAPRATHSARDGDEAARSELYLFPTRCLAPCLQGQERDTAEGVATAAHRMRLLRASTWHRHGCTALAAAEAAAVASAAAVEPGDALHAYARLALLALDRQGPAAAELVLAAALEEFPMTASEPLAAARLEVVFWRALRHGDLPAAHASADALCALPHPLCNTELDIRAQAETLKLHVVAASGQWREAYERGGRLIATCLHNGLQAEAAVVQHAVAAAALAGGQPALALPYTLSALYHGAAQHMDALAAAAAVQLAQIKVALSVGMATEAAELVEEHLGFIEGDGSLVLRAESHALLAEAVLRTAASPAALAAQRASVERHLAAASAAAEAAEWWEMSERAATLLALTRHVCGDEVGCSSAAQAALSAHDATAALQQSCLA